MNLFDKHIGLDQPARYAIKIQGRLNGNNRLEDWFLDEPGCTYENGEDGETVTVLTGMVADQAALHGLLTRIRDLGLTLLFVDCLSARSDTDPSSLP